MQMCHLLTHSGVDTHLKYYFLGVVHFRGSPFGESMDWGSAFCPSPNFYNSVTSKPEDGLE